ncbi:chain-length determining protein [Pseudooceanicola lipolyticus]|uniref:non-specific protein-tyrosine kinase n=2 Tax=Pseudooceanicola TaxID=1679449 RepID=A0A2M8J042_9RHOB|nr:polysaccharide biosynthesis tyrosine autokinase [Pseudooceanicola lipolyticus]PJE36147.1 chain-length determining protein [Pseudooceanicola lipolyticus]
MTQPFPKLATTQPAQVAASAEMDDVIDLGALLSVLWRGKWIIGFITVLAVLAGGYYAYVAATPLYTAKSVVMLETREERVTDLESVIGGLSGDSSVINSEAEVLRSRSLLKKVVAQLNLERDPEFNADLRPPEWQDQVKARIRGAIASLLPAGPETTPAVDEYPDAQTEALVNALLARMTVRNIPQSLVFEITVKTEQPQKSARIADKVAELYVLNQIEVKFEATEQATTWLTERVTQLQTELELAESRVKDFTASTALVNAESLQAQERQLKELRDRIQAMQLSATNVQARVEALRSAGTPEDKAAIANDSRLTRLLQEASSDPTAMTAFDLRYQQIIDRGELELSRANSQLAALSTSRDEMQTQIETQGQDLIRLQQLTREAEASRLLYEHFLSRLKETAAQEGIQQADSRVLSQAVPPAVPSEPRKSLVLAMAGMLGLMLGVGLVLIREARKNTYRTARDLELSTGYTVMGQVPLLPARKRRDTVTYLATKPTSAAAEAIRNLRTSIMLSNVDRPPKVIVTTSSIPGEGKTMLSLALAQNFSGMGKKVLLIEGDIRRRVIGQYLGQAPKDGLLSVLSGTQPLSELVVHDDGIGADILIGEKTSANAADIFSSESFARLLAEAKREYDLIVLDTPPVLVVPDARIIAQNADVILFAVKWDSTSKSQVEEALRMFESVNQRVSGLILNHISPKGMKRYGYGGKYGAYSAYGRKYYVN